MKKLTDGKEIYDSSIFKTDIAKNMFEQMIKVADMEESKNLELMKLSDEDISSIDVVGSHFSMILEVYRTAADIECNFRNMNANVAAMVNSIQELK
jgi:hypothetical protein